MDAPSVKDTGLGQMCLPIQAVIFSMFDDQVQGVFKTRARMLELPISWFLNIMLSVI